jgi:ankyrin repeat protein
MIKIDEIIQNLINGKFDGPIKSDNAYLVDIINWAAGNGNRPDIVNFLINFGVKADWRTLSYASGSGNMAAVRILVDYGIDIHTNQDWALQMSVFNNHMDITKFLVENGADISADNYAVFKWMMMKKDLKMARFLINSGADITDKVVSKSLEILLCIDILPKSKNEVIGMIDLSIVENL